MTEEVSNPIINCHTHIFTIDHVPNSFGKSILPSPLDRIFTVKNVKWYYRNYTTRGSRKHREFIRKWTERGWQIKDLMKKTGILWLIWSILSMITHWILGVLARFFKIDGVFSEDTKETIRRFKTMARYSMTYKNQSRLFKFLQTCYPPNTEFVVLTMDMDYMEAGAAKLNYIDQLREVERLRVKHKNLLKPFVFLHPKRLEKLDTGSFKYEDFVLKGISQNMYSGFKIYPALGYYPFDENLIPLYEFAVKNNIPIMTHCIAGTVFWRGKKKKKWHSHPILKSSGSNQKLPLKQAEAKRYSTNFTHPYNYQCLLNPKILSEYLGREIDLSNLKICLGHFGGSHQWNKYLKDAWNRYENTINPCTKDEYLKSPYKNTLNHKNMEQIWWDASWLSIIYDLMVQYDNVYADVSFILHNQGLHAILKNLLHDPKVKNKILFGTDFYVVSQKGVDKLLYQNLRSHLGESLFHMIAVENPKTYLNSKFSKMPTPNKSILCSSFSQHINVP